MKDSASQENLCFLGRRALRRRLLGRGSLLGRRCLLCGGLCGHGRLGLGDTSRLGLAQDGEVLLRNGRGSGRGSGLARFAGVGLGLCGGGSRLLGGCLGGRLLGSRSLGLLLPLLVWYCITEAARA